MSDPDEKRGASSRRVSGALANLLIGGGAGHIAQGRYTRGLAWFAADGAVLLLLVLGILALPPVLFWVGFPAAFVLRVASIVDIIRLGPAPAGVPAWGRTLLYWVLLVAMNRGGALAIRGNLVEAFKIPAGSMAPTLLPGDHVFVNKLKTDPRRGDIIVFRYPKDPEMDFIKRVVAVGGDTIEMRDNVLVVNGQTVARHPAEGTCTYDDLDEANAWTERDCEAWQETLAEAEYRVIQDRGAGLLRTFPATQIPPGHFFVLGDNRDNSHDSRFWGTVPADHVKGRALFIWYSGGPNGTRWDRINRVLR